MKNSLIVLAAALSMVCFGCGDARKEAAKVDPAVIADLQAAFNGESNAAAKYAMYAEKAAESGYASVAALFRAASKSESMHAKRQGKVLKSLGVEPKAEIKLPEYVDVTTALKDGLTGETYELTTMYPEFISRARAGNAPPEVIEAFSFALDAEKEHAKFYSAALADTEAWKAAGKQFYVCTVCGYTTDSPVMVCILCAAPGEKFEVFK